MRDRANRLEFEEIKANIIALKAELDTLLAPPHVFATVLKINRKPFEKDGVQKLLIVYDGKIFEVEASSGLNLNLSDNVLVELVTKRVRTNTIPGASS